MNNMFTHLTENYEACVAVILFAIGMCMLLFDKNLLKKVIGLDIMDSGTFLLLADRGYITGRTVPIITGGSDRYGPLHQPHPRRTGADGHRGVGQRVGADAEPDHPHL